MGNRILKDTIRINRRIDALSYFEEVVFYRLITAADDFGVYSANPVMLARTLFPLRESVDGKTMAEALKHLEDVGLVRCYSVKDEGDWLQIVSWGKHQRLRNSRRIYPGPEEEDCAPEGEQSSQEGDELEQEQQDQPEQEAEVRELPVAVLPLNDGTVYGVTRQQADDYAALYPRVDVDRELCRMREWCLSNGEKRKSRNDIRRFINGWLSRAQERGSPSGVQPVNQFVMMAAAEGITEQLDWLPGE